MTNTEMSLETNDGFAVIKMHGKGVYNPTTLELVNSLLDQVEDNADAVALIFTGEDKNFSQGLDLDYLLKLEHAQFIQFVENTMVMVSRILSLPIPVVAAINGHAFGLGAMIALACDYRVMREDRGFICLPEIDLNMSFTPAMNALVVNKLSGQLRRDMMLTGRRVSGQDAYAQGLVDACGAEDVLIGLAKEVVAPALNKDRKSMSQIKKDLNMPIILVVETGAGVRGSAV
ncbi:MAG: enoyl-CoA hydratase/carnithine racemase [Cryomorphaceae bacterium]